MIKAVLFDMDGVLNMYHDVFSEVYAKRENLDPESIREFFKQYWAEVLVDNIDLKVLLKEHADTWNLKADPQTLLDDWFKTEDEPNKPLLDVVKDLRSAGIHCYVATNNEQYRVSYIRHNTFKDQVDGIFASAELKSVKPSPEFFHKIIGHLQLDPSEIAFFDDTPGHVEAAKRLGIKAYLYESPEQVKQVLGGSRQTNKASS